MSSVRDKFWQSLSLGELNDEEWEALCDGCGKCCLNKLEDEESGELAYTAVACRQLDESTCRCKNYPQRKDLVPECIVIDINQPEIFEWLPGTCAYRRLYENKALEAWHPLISGNCQSVQLAGHSVAGKVISEEFVHPDALEEYVVQWV
ncbi:hypothetical protein SAMN02745866_00632 [Alteromonadaceae bacterium Bs31]|nr:hypothetical protein SAMN02745866_00632 [Alteromonadaceae bacterium Bs31]